MGEFYGAGKHPSCNGKPDAEKAFEYFDQYLKSMSRGDGLTFSSIIWHYQIRADKNLENNQMVWLYCALLFIEKKGWAESTDPTENE